MVFCSNCLQYGHNSKVCSSPIICRRCHKSGHKKSACTSSRGSAASGSPPPQQHASSPPLQQQAPCDQPSGANWSYAGAMKPEQLVELVKTLQGHFPEAGFVCELLGDQAFVHACFQVEQKPLRPPSETAFGGQAAQPGRPRRRGKRGGKRKWNRSNWAKCRSGCLDLGSNRGESLPEEVACAFPTRAVEFCRNYFILYILIIFYTLHF